MIIIKFGILCEVLCRNPVGIKVLMFAGIGMHSELGPTMPSDAEETGRIWDHEGLSRAHNLSVAS